MSGVLKPGQRYAYEHVAGYVVPRPARVVEANGMTPAVYFEGPNVKRWWIEDESTLEGRPQELKPQRAAVQERGN